MGCNSSSEPETMCFLGTLTKFRDILVITWKGVFNASGHGSKVLLMLLINLQCIRQPSQQKLFASNTIAPRLRNPELYKPMLFCQELLPDFLSLFSLGQTDFSIPLSLIDAHLFCSVYSERPFLTILSKIPGKVQLPSEIYLVPLGSVVPTSQVVLDFRTPCKKTSSQLFMYKMPL